MFVQSGEKEESDEKDKRQKTKVKRQTIKPERDE
jgi:hypothetical protein